LGRPIGWGLIFLWVSNTFITAQTTEDILGLIQQDEDDAIHEDEIILLDDILLRSSGLSLNILLEIRSLSFLADEDYILIQTALDQNDMKSLTKSNKISPILKTIIEVVQNNKSSLQKVFIQQHTSITGGNRYRWRGKINTPIQEISAISVRNRGVVDILGQNSIYIVHHSKKGRWIAGDHQMAFGFGLVSGKPFPSRKGWNTVNTGTSIYTGLGGYKSSTGIKRIRGIAIEQNTALGTISLSYGQTNLDVAQNKGTTKGAWQYGNKLMSVGTVLTSDIQSVFASYNREQIRTGGEISFGTGSPSLIVGFHYGIPAFKYLVQYRDIYPNSLAKMGNPMVEWKGSEISERGLFQGAFIRLENIRLMIYADVFHHHIRRVNGYEFGIRSETKLNRHRVVFQIKTEKKDKFKDVIYPPLIFPSVMQKDGVKLEYRYGADRWRTDVKYQFIRAGDLVTNDSHGLDLRFHFLRNNYRIELDWMAAQVGSFDSRIYFWDVNLPGEMMTRMIFKSSHSQGIKVLFNLKNRSRLGVKLRLNHTALSFRTDFEISGGIFIQTAL
jgi:hypothetical protein|tara:strand:- start:11998 stop:13662 length:1665 start_codon:yes stop_codon:yes gene_type:complete